VIEQSIAQQVRRPDPQVKGLDDAPKKTLCSTNKIISATLKGRD
jgi:hypothetical protein